MQPYSPRLTFNSKWSAADGYSKTWGRCDRFPRLDFVSGAVCMNAATLEVQLARLSEQLKTLTEKVDDAADKRQEQDDRLEHIEDRLSKVEAATSGSIVDWIQNHWRIVGLLSATMPIPLVAMTIGLYQMYGQAAIEFLRDEIKAATVDDSIIFQPVGLSFVKTPVIEGGKARYVLVARRTEVGKDCAYRGMVPIFTDELGRTLTSTFDARGRQFGTEMVRTELDLQVPDGLIPGRVVVTLQMDYGDCGQDETYPVAFQLLPKPVD